VPEGVDLYMKGGCMLQEYIIKIDGKYWCGDSEEEFGHMVSGGFFSMCPAGNLLYKPKLSINRKDALTVIDPVSNIQNILRKVRNFQKVEIERV
jgi:hypothetical protein